MGLVVDVAGGSGTVVVVVGGAGLVVEVGGGSGTVVVVVGGGVGVW